MVRFLVWYMGEGFRSLVGSPPVWLAFLWRVFWIRQHLATLLAPWHRDVSFRQERGLHPGLMLQRLADNMFARVMGALVRTATILAGLAAIAATFTFFGFATLAWYVLPLCLVAGVWLLVAGAPMLGAVLTLVPLAVAAGAVTVYRARARVRDYRAMPFAALHEEPWFDRVYARCGLTRADVTPAMLTDFAAFTQALRPLDMTVEDFQVVLEREMRLQEERDAAGLWWLPERLARVRPIGQYWAYGYTVYLDRYSMDLSLHTMPGAAQAELAGRTESFDMMALTLARRTDNSVLLVGDAGVGRKTLVHHLAWRIRNGMFDHDPWMRDKRVLLVDLAEAVASARHEGGDLAFFLHSIFHEAAYAGNVVLVVDQFHRFVAATETSTDITPVLADYLALPSFQMIALTSHAAFNRELDGRDDILRYFTAVDVDELPAEATVAVLLDKFAVEERGGVIFTYPALRDCVRLSGRYRVDAPLPERAIDLATELILYWRDGPAAGPVTPETVRAFLTTKTGMPMGAIDDDERERLLHLEDMLHERVIGQEEAIRQIAEAVRIMRSGIADQKKPMSSFLFLGPTGVGKTETAKALAAVYYGDENAMIRLDMSEFQGPDAYKLLLGDEETGALGRLTTAAREHPYALLLLDELEKAHPRALDIFLQVLDEGFVTDASGTQVSFRNMIIIATSNAGAVFLRDELAAGRAIADVKQPLIDRIVHDGVYRLEFLNRFSDVILFRPLTPDELAVVVRLMCDRIATRIRQEKNIDVTVADDVVPAIIAAGYDPLFGARSVARHIDDTVTDALARRIIAGDVAPGGAIVITAADLPRR